MITIPNGALVGATKDALQFTAPPKDFPELAKVRYSWDGVALHVTATNILAGCEATWDPDSDDNPDEGGDWGGADEPWSVVIDADAAKHIVKSLGVPAKLDWVPLTVEVDRAHLVVKRSRDTGLPAVHNRYAGSLDEFPDVAAVIADIGKPEPSETVAWSWPGMTAVSKVAKRRGAPAELLSCPKATGVVVGAGFHAFVKPAEVGA